MITLKNKSKRMKTYNLDRHHGKLRNFPQVRPLANGGSVGEIVKKKLPDSITFLAGEIKSKHNGKPIPASVKDCPEIKAALERGELVDVTAVAPRPSPQKAQNQPPTLPDAGRNTEGGDSSGSNDGGNEPDSSTVASSATVGDDSGSSESSEPTSKKKTSKRGR